VNLAVRQLTSWHFARWNFISSTLTAEEIQDVVEEVLHTSPFRRTSRAFVVYSSDHIQSNYADHFQNFIIHQNYLILREYYREHHSNTKYHIQGIPEHPVVELTLS
jgi:ribonucleoside-triphosphate reductase